ncbi:MAG: 3-deoxy-D-manno-octulosonic acid transferase [Bacteroidales bacterium]|nr:3-deoxy-D-manno-octulosonic acid transferase [Bacteroidales bacterium]
MNLLYHAGIHLYSMAVKAVSPRHVKASKMVAGQRQSLERLRQALEPGRRYVWVHAASLGEFEQGRPLMERLRRDHPELGIVLTFFSPSGYEVRKNYAGADVVCYLPFDTRSNAQEWVSTLRPAMAIFVKYEFWGNYLQALQRQGVPTYLISAIFRADQPFFKWWGHQWRKMLGFYTHIFVQDEASRQRLEAVGVKGVTVAGDTRFDRVTDILHSTIQMPHVEAWAKNHGSAREEMTLVVGSSWGADEQLYMPWLREHPEVKVIIAPHEFDEERVSRLQQEVGGRVVRFSEVEAGASLEGVRGIIVDCFGKLSSLYRYGDAAYIGGGFGEGIHNINEAAVYSIPVVFGPRHQKFKEATDLIKAGGGFCVRDEGEVKATLSRLLTDDAFRRQAGQAAGEYIQRSIGATDKICRHLGL